ncbi:MAG: hypothetical protein NC253_09095 [Ruminococcus sp.]|nr:hypothetical protein [Ruminococcus sp.]MCM1382595.1 hypothetical protein [Muribaculaceae bacterium]MCM1478378.1 hypothetical protein [Muribaculaceae bacterium]
MSNGEIKDVKLALLFELRLIIKKGGKENYTKEELFDLFDQIAENDDL